MQNKFWLVLGFTISSIGFFAAGCGNDTTTPAQPGTVPTVTPTASQIPANTWVSALETKDCPFPDCPARNGFQVDSQGNFSFGGGASGQISAADLATLSTQASAVAAENLNAAQTCNNINVLPGMSSITINLSTSDGVSHQVYNLSTQNSTECWIGDRTMALQLSQTMDTLANKYAAGPSPSPSPSPSPA